MDTENTERTCTNTTPLCTIMRRYVFPRLTLDCNERMRVCSSILMSFSLYKWKDNLDVNLSHRVFPIPNLSKEVLHMYNEK